MTALTLREHKWSDPVPLTQRQLQALLKAPLEVRPGPGTGLYQLKPSSLVGELWVDGLQISIRPKVDDVRTVLHMMVKTGELPRWFVDPVHISSADGLIDLIAAMYAQAVQRLLQRGLYRAYQTQEENLGYLRGRILPDAQLRVNAAYPHRLYCGFTEHTIDVAENRALRAVLTVLSRHRLTSPHVALLITRLHSAFDAVSHVPVTADAIEGIPLTRLTVGYRDALTLAALIIRHMSVEQGDGGTVPYQSFLLDMNRLYERYITVVLGGMLEGSGYDLAAQRPGYLDNRHEFRAKPDLLFFVRHHWPVLVGDVKYKAPSDGQPLQADLYQVLAYARIWGLSQGVLIYEGVQPREITMAGPADRPITVHVLRAEIAGTSAQLDRRMQALADRVVELVKDAAADFGTPV